MKGNTADQRHLTDTNHPSNLSMSVHDRSQQEDSNIFLLPMNDNLNISTIEDTVIPKLGSSSQRGPSRQLSTGKIQTLTSSQVVNARVSTSRFQSNPMIIPPSENTSMDFSRPIQLDESEIISRSTSEKRNIGHFLAVKESKVPLGLRETDNTIKYTSGDDDRFNQSKPIDLKDYGSYDYREEQDVVHSLGIKNQYVTRRSGRENRIDNLEEEEVKEVTGSGKDKGNVNNNNRQEIQRVAAEVITIRSSSANIAVRDVEESALDESAVEQQNAEPRRNNSNASNNNNNERQNQGQNERQNRGNNVTANAQQLATQQATTAQQSVQGLEVRPYLRIRIGFFATLMACSVLLWLYLKRDVELTHIMIPLYPYFTYLFVEGIVGGFKTQRLERWQQRDHKLDAFSAVTCIAALILVHLQLLGKLSNSVFAVVPLLISTTIYPFHSIASDSIKISSAMFRFICTLQTALITLKLDGIIEIDWAFVLLVCLVYMGVALAYCIIYGFFILLLFILSIFRGYRGGALGRKIQFLGLVWYFLYYGISGITFIVIVGVSQANEVKGNSNLLQIAAKVGVVLGAFLMVYSSIFFKSLVKFIFVHFEAGGLVGNPRNPNAERPRPTISFLVANDETYFINLSSTYFLPLTPGFMAKSKENIERIKSLFRDFRLRKPQTKQADKNASTTKGRKKIKIQTLKEYKKTLDEKLTNLFKRKNEEPNSPGTALNKFLQYFSPKQANIPRKFNINPDSSTAKLSLSVGNLDDLEGVYSVQKPNTAAGEEEKLCYLCYAHPPDSILMNCGHGGFCYDCAISAIKAKNECMECRTKVDFIHKIDSEKNLKGIVKAVEVRKVIVTEPPQIDNPFR